MYRESYEDANYEFQGTKTSKMFILEKLLNNRDRKIQLLVLLIIRNCRLSKTARTGKERTCSP